MKKNREKKNRIRWISIFFIAIIAYGIGLITAKYRIFPYQQIKNIKNFMVADKENNNKENRLKAGKKKFFKNYYYDRKSFFEVNGSKADIVMIGDSITDGAEWNELFPNISIANRGIGGDTTAGVLNRMESIYSTNAKKAFIMLGVNDLGRNISVDEVFSKYEKIVFQLKQHGITPYIQSVLFLGDKYADKNKDVLKLNLKLQELSEKENVVFIDLNKVLSENGKLKKSVSSKDDIHLNGEGFFEWKNSIKKYIQ
jgi:lysophospholipase L1-like esterase